MRALDRKLARDLWRLRWQVLSIASLVACGVMVVVGMRSTYDSLDDARERYYRASRFGDVFASLKRAPEGVADRLARLPGVTAVETRVVLDVTLDVPGLREPATGHVVSVPRRTGGLNLLHLRAGRLPEPGRAGEAVLSERFAEANALRVGDSLGAVVNGRWQRLHVVGVALSPEYVFEAQPGLFITNNRLYGVLWMDRDALAFAYAMRGAFNDVVLSLAPGASTDAVVDAVDGVLRPWGGFGAYGREDQPSNRILRDEERQNRITGIVVPLIFLGVAAFLLNVVLSRLVGIERDQIGVLKAFGYTDVDVGRHYLRFALLVVLLGALLGIGGGLWLGRGFTRLYGEYFRFPDLRYRASWGLVLGSVALSAAAAAGGALAAVRRAVRLPPAEAMRPEAPARFHAGRIDRLLPRLAPDARMVLRSLVRRPARAFLSALGVGLGTSILITGFFFFDAINYMADLQFYVTQRQDLTVAFRGPRALAVRHDLAHLPGVTRVETWRAVPVRLRAAQRSRRLGIMGLEPGTALRRVADRDGMPVTLPPDGLLLTTTLAEVLGVRPGDSLTVEVLEGARPVRRVPVAATVDELLGTAAYMDLRALARLLGEAPAASGADLALDAAAEADVYRALKRMPLLAGVSSRHALLLNFRNEMTRSLRYNAVILSILAGVIALGIVYNGARITLSERGRELASLRVLGFTEREVGSILLGEQALLMAAGIPIGYAIGAAFCWVLITALHSEVYRIPLTIRPPTFVLAAGVIVLASVVAGLAVVRRISRMDLVEVLKTRE
ncbi:MAG TPA: ABC transporter permease [Longimicrobiales bacterium]|nr:ABC transporter permease [Longimicrobiales bacterium]